MRVIGSPAATAQGRQARHAEFRPDSHHLSSVSAAVDRAVSLLLSRQAFDGHWVGELQGDTILESEYILLLAFLGREGDPKVAKIARYLLIQQMPDDKKLPQSK